MALQLIIVLLVVCVAILFMGRKFWRAIKSPGHCDSCDHKTPSCCAACKGTTLEEIKPK